MTHGRRTSVQARALGLAQALVRLPSPPGQEQGVADAIEGEMRTLGYDSVTRDALGSVIGVVDGAAGQGRTVLFDAHLDTVPVPDADAWSCDPYGGLVADDRLWGRGATDVKGSLAALVVAVGMVPRSRLAGRVIVAATVGEEMVEGLALGRVLGEYRADAVVVCEPTGLRIGIGHKGRAALVVQAAGVAAHSSTPGRGVNAVYRMMEAVQRIRAVPARTDAVLGEGVTELVEIVSEPFPGTSMVASGCRARFDRRLVRGETRDSVLEEVQAALGGLEGVTVRFHRAPLCCYTGARLDVEDVHPAWAVDPGSDVVRRARDALRAAGLGDDLYLAPYCTNGATSAGELGVPTLVYGAGEIADAHVVDESLSVDELYRAVQGYAALAPALSAP